MGFMSLKQERWQSICHTSVADAQSELVHWKGKAGITDIDRALNYLDSLGWVKKTLRVVLLRRRFAIQKEMKEAS